MAEQRIIIPRERITYNVKGKTHYNHKLCLAQLLLDDQIHLGEGRARDDETEVVCAWVICNDIFAWAFADLEPVCVDELPALYEQHMADPVWGTVVWTIRHRGERPQPPVEVAMRAAGAWPFADDELRPNTTDAETQALFAQAAAQHRQRVAEQREEGDSD